MIKLLANRLRLYQKDFNMSSTANSPVRLYLMQVAALPPAGVPIVCYLIQTGDGKNILIDSGLPQNMPPMPDRPMPVMGKNVIEQLAQIGIQPTDIQLFVGTHFDGDHAGNNELFPNAEFIVQRAHYDATLTSPRFARSRSHWDQPTLHYRFVDGDTTLVPDVELIETSGHATGHQSVLVRLPETGSVLLTIDAVMEQSRFVADVQASPMDENETALCSSTRKLIDLAEKEHAALIVFGHDAEQWKTLRKLPEFYS